MKITNRKYLKNRAYGLAMCIHSEVNDCGVAAFEELKEFMSQNEMGADSVKDRESENTFKHFSLVAGDIPLTLYNAALETGDLIFGEMNEAYQLGREH